MNSLFEYTDKLQAPFECFVFDTAVHNFPIESHWHYFMEIIYMIEGTAIMNCDEETFVTEPGDMVLFLPYQVHSIYAVASMTLKYYVMKFDVGSLNPVAGEMGTIGAGIHFSTLFRSAKGNKNAMLCFRAKETEEGKLERIFENGCVEMERQDYGYQVMMKSYISSLLTYVLRRWRENGFDTDKAFYPESEEENIYFITEYIDGHIQETLKVEELARLCNMSYSFFAKCFRELYGQSCKKYIEFVRLCKAEDLLLFTNQDLSYISQETGFADCSHFIKAFKEKHGMTPKQYRKERKG